MARRSTRAFGLSLLCLIAACRHGPRGPEGEDQALDTTVLLGNAEKSMRALDVDQAQAQLDRAGKLLGDPRVTANPDAEILQDRYREDLKLMPQVRKERDKRDLALKVAAQGQAVEKARGELLQASGVLEKPDVAKGDLDQVKDALLRLEEQLKAGKPLETQDASYFADASHARHLAEKTREPLALAQKKLAFADDVWANAEKGIQLLAKARAEKDPTAKKVARSEAATALRLCAAHGDAEIARTPALANAPLRLAAKDTTPARVVATCTAELKAVEKAPPAKKARGKKKR